MSWLSNAFSQLRDLAEEKTNKIKQNASQFVDAVIPTNTSNTNVPNTETATVPPKNNTQGQPAQSNNQMNALNNALSVSGGTKTSGSVSTPTTTGSAQKTYAEMSDEEKRAVAIEAYRDVYDRAIANGNVGGAALWARNAAVDLGVTFTPSGTKDNGMSASDRQLAGVYEDIYTAAMERGDVEAAEEAKRMSDWVRSQYGDPTSSPGPTGTAGLGVSGNLSWDDNYNKTNAQPTYTSKYDPQIDALLSEILTREDFSYDAESDPLFGQYSKIYNREGERAMRDTLAEAAAGAGGMNTYAIAAANQARNYYASQLNDRIPELYQLAYEMYLQDKESKIQDLGLLSDMDDKQYSRYRDTMNDWRADKDFAYGAFKDAVAQDNWEKTFNYNQSVDNRNFAYQDYWAEKEWSASEQSKAQDEVWKRISLGVTPSPDLVDKAGMDQTEIDLLVAAANAGGTGDTVTGNPVVSSGVTKEIRDKCASFTNNNALGNYLDGLERAEVITPEDANSLYAEYVDDNEKYILNQDGTYSDTHSYSDMIKSTSGWKVDTNAVKGGTGGGNLVGIDKDAVVIAPNGEPMRLDVLREKLIAENMDKSEANKYIKNLQNVLGISSNGLFGW